MLKEQLLNTGNDFNILSEIKTPEKEFAVVEKIISADEIECGRYFSEGKKGRPAFSEQGGKLSLDLWNNILDSAGDNRSVENIVQTAGATFEHIDESTEGSPKTKGVLKHYLKLATEARIKQVEQKELNAEIFAFSPWRKVQTEIKNLHSEKGEAFVENFTNNWILGLRHKVKKNASEQLGYQDRNEYLRGRDLAREYEIDLADMIGKTLDAADSETLSDIKAEGLNSLLELSLEKFADGNNLKEDVQKVIKIKTKTDEIIIKDNTSATADSQPEIESEIEFMNEFKEVSIFDVCSEIIEPDISTLEQMKLSISSTSKKISEAFHNNDFKKRAFNTVTLVVAGISSLTTSSKLFSQQEIEEQLVKENITSSNEIESRIDFSSELSAEKLLDRANLPSKRNQAVLPTQTEQPITPEPTATQEPAATPTPVLKEVTYRYGEKLILNFTNNDKVTPISFTPRLYNDEFSREDAGSFLNSVKPGKGNSSVFTDKYGNLFTLIHSGYHNLKANPAETLRQSVEGGTPFNKARTLSEEESRANLKQYEGTIVEGVNEDGTREYYMITTVGHIPHESNSEYVNDTRNALDVLIRENGGEDSSFNVYSGERNAKFIEYCGWAPSKLAGSNGWYVWTKYVFALEPIENLGISQESIELEVENQKSNNLLESILNQNERPSALRESATQLSEIINSYSEIYPYIESENQPEVLLGDHIKSSEWYGNKSQEEQEKMESILNLINNKTYGYVSETGVHQAIQCIDYEGLLFSLENGPKHNLVGSSTEVVYPGEALDLSEYSNFSEHSTDNVELESLTTGKILIQEKHVWIVVDQTEGLNGPEVWLSDANRKRDGKVEVVKVTSSEELANLIGPTIFLE